MWKINIVKILNDIQVTSLKAPFSWFLNHGKVVTFKGGYTCVCELVGEMFSVCFVKDVLL